MDGDNKVVSKINVNLRTRPFAIDPNDRSRESSIGIPVDPVNAPVVLDNLGECKLAAAQQKETQEEHGDRCTRDEEDEGFDISAGGRMAVYNKNFFQVTRLLRELSDGVCPGREHRVMH